MAALLGQPWQQSTIEAALVALREDVNVAPTAPGGRGEYRNSLAASFLYKFYVHVSDKCMLACCCALLLLLLLSPAQGCALALWAFEPNN